MRKGTGYGAFTNWGGILTNPTPTIDKEPYFTKCIYFYQIVRVLPDCIFYPTKPSFLNYPALSPFPYLRKLIHLTFRKNTTSFYTQKPAPPPRIKVSARATQPFPHASAFFHYTTWQKNSFKKFPIFARELLLPDSPLFAVFHPFSECLPHLYSLTKLPFISSRQ